MSFKQVQSNANIKQIDTKTNKFNWKWLQDKDGNGMFLSEWLRKVDLDSRALCLLCNSLLKYGSGGKTAIMRHALSNDHVKWMNARKVTACLPSEYGADTTADCGLPYGAPANIHDANTCNNPTEKVLPKVPSFKDRVSHTEAFIISFMAENTLPFAMVPKLIEFSKFLAQDVKVLSKLSISRTTASYKLVEGLAPVVLDGILENMKSTPFSINVDECFSNNHNKIFAILVSYFSEAKGEVVVQHYKSKSFTVINAKNLSSFVLNSLENDHVPLDNLISSLSDSTNYMRGKKGGFETLVREKAPHLLDIDGDVCHHAHNAAGKFLQPFGSVVEKFATDLHTEMQFSTDLRDYLSEICEMMSIPYHMPPSYTEHRWLSVLTSADIDKEMLPALTVLYYGFIPKDLKHLYQEEFDEVSRSCSPKARLRTEIIHINSAKKKLTDSGRERKKRMVFKLFEQRNTTLLHLNFYTHLLPLIKSFILVFEQKEPMVHRLHDEIVSCFKTFLCCFIKVDHVSKVGAKELQKIDVTDTKLYKPFTDWNLGTKTFKLLKKVTEEDQNAFKNGVKNAFVAGAQYLQKKLPLTNEALKLLSCVDPACQGVEIANKIMKKLPSLFPTVIESSQIDMYNAEVDKFHLLTDLPTNEVDGKTKKLDHWWHEVLKKHDLPLLSKIIKACLSIFTGPRIEQQFSLMNSLLTKETNRLNVETVSALQTVKMDLIASKEQSTQRYYRRNYLKSPVTPWLVKGIQNASNLHKKKLAKNTKRADDRRSELNVEPVSKKKKLSMHQRAEKVKRRSIPNFC